MRSLSLCVCVFACVCLSWQAGRQANKVSRSHEHQRQQLLDRPGFAPNNTPPGMSRVPHMSHRLNMWVHHPAPLVLALQLQVHPPRLLALLGQHDHVTVGVEEGAAVLVQTGLVAAAVQPPLGLDAVHGAVGRVAGNGAHRQGGRWSRWHRRQVGCEAGSAVEDAHTEPCCLPLRHRRLQTDIAVLAAGNGGAGTGLRGRGRTVRPSVRRGRCRRGPYGAASVRLVVTVRLPVGH
mmetsp:Transcript_5221/g.12300  ORF Transcript_5221/g.12300 Transcript_5221/m.12300 type:complete len:235 (-) Transcript_5221:162-866(-)